MTPRGGRSGKPDEMACPECGDRVASGARYCSECGARLSAQSAPVSPTRRLTPQQWENLWQETVINLLILTPVIYVPMTIHTAWEMRDTHPGAARRLVGYTTAGTVAWAVLAWVALQQFGII